MRFQPRTEADIKAESNQRNLWPKGTYDFEVVNASDEVSKNGNDMIKLVLKVYDQSGRSQMVWDYLLEAMAEKLVHACEALGLNDRYDSGELDASDFDGKAGQVVLYIQKGQNGYADKNAVADYVKPKGGTERVATAPRAAKPSQRTTNQDINDDIPF
jgi:hypothetical protein